MVFEAKTVFRTACGEGREGRVGGAREAAPAPAAARLRSMGGTVTPAGLVGSAPATLPPNLLLGSALFSTTGVTHPRWPWCTTLFLTGPSIPTRSRSNFPTGSNVAILSPTKIGEKQSTVAALHDSDLCRVCGHKTLTLPTSQKF